MGGAAVAGAGEGAAAAAGRRAGVRGPGVPGLARGRQAAQPVEGARPGLRPAQRHHRLPQLALQREELLARDSLRPALEDGALQPRDATRRQEGHQQAIKVPGKATEVSLRGCGTATLTAPPKTKIE